MLAAVFGQRHFGAPPARPPVVDPGVLHDAEQPRGQVRALAKLAEIAQRALDPHLNQVVGVVLIARQHAREAPQPRQQGDQACTDFLHVRSHAFMQIIRGRGWVSSMAGITASLCRMLAVTVLAGAAHAQLPDVDIPDMPSKSVPLPGGIPQATDDLANGALRGADRGLRRLTGARMLRIETLSRENRDLL